MSEYQNLTVLAAFAFLYSLVASRLERTPVSGALVYVVIGVLCGPTGLGLVELEFDSDFIKLLAELTLAVVLFSDSASANLRVLRRTERLPIRLLLIGLPLTIALGFGLGYLLFDDMGPYAIAVLATMLAPTDAALGKAVVTNEDVPDEVREALNVESGLNDGICVPVLLIFLALAAETVSGDAALGMMFRLPVKAIGIGGMVGVCLSLSGGWAMRTCYARQWLSKVWEEVPIVSLALLCFALAQLLGGSGFIAAFVGGMIFGATTTNHKATFLNRAEGTGNLLSLITWFVFGAIAVGPQIEYFTVPVLAYAVLSLTVVRMLPVFLSVLGIVSCLDTKLFLGWFGPRGLASIVFAVMVAAENLPAAETLFATVSATILLSVIFHGVSANLLAKWYGRRVSARDGLI